MIKKIYKKSSKGYIQVESNEVNLEEGKMKELHGYIAKGMSAQQIAKKMNVDVKTIETLMKEEVESNLQEKEIRHDGKGPIKMSKKEYDKINKFRKGDIRGKPHVMATIKKGGFDYNMLVPVIFEDVELNEKEMTYTVVHIKKGKEVIKAKSSYDAAKKFAKMKSLQAAMIDNNRSLKEETVFVVRFEKEGMRFAVPFRDMKMAKDGEKILKKSAGVSGLSVTKDILKPGIKLSTQEGRIVKEENLSVNLMELKYGEIIIDTKNSNISKQILYYLKYDIMHDRDPKLPYIDGQTLDVDYEYETDRQFRITPDMNDRDIKKVAAHLKKKYGNSIKLQLEGVEQEEWMLDDNSIMSRATRLISQTAIKEKLDPADVDVRATDLDRKAADKNIFIQLKRAQDMKGKTDVEFLDKKKHKIDIRVINKALDMFDKMKPNDKLKMQTAIGKSYRDLLKVVQRGKV